MEQKKRRYGIIVTIGIVTYSVEVIGNINSNENEEVWGVTLRKFSGRSWGSGEFRVGADGAVALFTELKTLKKWAGDAEGKSIWDAAKVVQILQQPSVFVGDMAVREKDVQEEAAKEQF